MKLKKALCIILAAAMITAAASACSKTADTSATEETVVVTDKSGEAVTTDDGKVVVEDVKTGTTKAVESTTKKGETTTKKGETTTAASTAKASTTAKATTKSSTTTAKKQESASTTKKATPSTTAAAQPIAIVLQKNGTAKCSSSNVTIQPASGTKAGIVFIDKGGDYLVTSSTDRWHGQIVIRLKNTESASVRFEDVTISNNLANVIKIIDTSISGERSFIETETSTGTTADDALRDEIKEISKQNSAPNVSLSFPTGTSSSFTTSANSYSGVIYNESKLTIKGNGSLKVAATKNANNAICSTKSVTIKNVSLSLSTDSAGSGAGRGIFSFSKVYLESGKLTINTDGDGIRCESFNMTGGSAGITSRSSDGVDADDAIILSGGTVNSMAVKSCYKVRRVNNTENGLTADGIRAGKNDTFAINGGTVTGEGKNITTVQPASKQPSITCRSVKAANTTEAKRALKFTIKSGSKTIKSSTTECIKFIYSSPSLSASKSYTVTGSARTVSKDFSANVTFKKTVGDARVVANR